METTLNVTLNNLTRQERLLIWMRREGVSTANIAKTLGVQPLSVYRWFNAERISTWRHRQLVECGIPAELLPPPVDIAPGRPRIQRQEALSNA